MENTSAAIIKRVISPPRNEEVPPVRLDLLGLLYHAENQEQFNGLNFKRWQKKMLLDLTTVNLATFLIEYAPELNVDIGNLPPKSVIRAWKESDRLCRNYILQGLVNEICNRHTMITTSKKLWKSLDREYNTEDVYVFTQCLEYKIVDSKTIVQQVQELQIIRNDIHAEGTTLSESFQVVAIIEKLPPAWVDFKNYLKQKRKEMSVEYLLRRLQIEEDSKCK